MTIKSGSGSNITLSIPNQSGLDRLHYSWTDTIPTSVFYSNKKPSSGFKVSCNKSTLRIEFTAPQNEFTSMKLFNLNGNVIKTMSLQTKAGVIYSQNFNLADIPEGYYIVKLENRKNTIKMSKVVLTR